MNYQQEYITSEYIELKMPAGRDNQGNPTFLLDPNHLHIWPRHSFMLIALPNKVCRLTYCSKYPSIHLVDRIKHLRALYLHLPRSLIASTALILS
jgi:kynurenine 3-monooxygenase